jgi:hypothetical protein
VKKRASKEKKAKVAGGREIHFAYMETWRREEDEEGYESSHKQPAAAARAYGEAWGRSGEEK